MRATARPALARITIAKFLDRSGPGVQQVAYTVADVDAASAALRERGVRLLYDEAGAARRITHQLRAPQGRRRRTRGIGGARRIATSMIMSGFRLS
jgi:hypothetical protein